MPLPTWLCGSTPQGEMTAFSRYHKVLEFLSSQVDVLLGKDFLKEVCVIIMYV